MAKKMLIDAAHPEETRVAVLDGKIVEDFDFETANRKQLRGNIYLAKVTRVEPSLQAAFVDYGGNRHGFLAFSEIHPDYYQIPVADREALMRAEEEAEREEHAAAEAADIAEAPADADVPAQSMPTKAAEAESVTEVAEPEGADADVTEQTDGAPPRPPQTPIRSRPPATRTRLTPPRPATSKKRRAATSRSNLWAAAVRISSRKAASGGR